MLSTDTSREYYTRQQVLLFTAITAAIGAAGGRYFFPSCPSSLPQDVYCAQYPATKVNSEPAAVVATKVNSKPAAVVESMKVGPNEVVEPEYLQKYDHNDHSKPLFAVPVKNGKTQHFSHIKFTPMQKSNAFQKPDWCISAPQYTPRASKSLDPTLLNKDVGGWVRNYISSHNCGQHGQVKWDTSSSAETSFGTALYTIAQKPEVNMIMEVGTWKGCGSTLLIGKGALDSGACVVTFEVVKSNHDLAAKNLADLPVKVVHGCGGIQIKNGKFGPVPKVASKDELERVAGPGIQGWPNDWKNWHKSEVAGCKASQESINDKDVYKDICAKYDFDFGVFDGGEFYAYAEFWGAMEHCKTMRYMAFDDIENNKYWMIYHQLVKNDNFKELYSSFKNPAANQRQGWAVFERIK